MIWNSKELENGLVIMSNDIKRVYDEYLASVDKITLDIANMNRKIIEISEKQINPELSLKMKEIDELKIITSQILKLLNQIYSKKEEKPKTPEERIQEILVSPVAEKIKEEKLMVSYCIKCNADSRMVNPEKEPIVNSSGRYIKGYCEVCNSPMFWKDE